MAPELLNTLDAAELRDLARQIEEWQNAKRLTDAAMLRKFSGLGSSKTYRNIRDGKLDELDLEKQLTNYRAVWALIESLGDEKNRTEDLYDNLSGVLQLKRVLFETMRETSPARFILVLGDTGMGKSSARALLSQHYGPRLLTVEASEAWGNSPMGLLGAILKAFGQKNAAVAQVDRLNQVIERLNQSRVCLFIEEGHHMRPSTLNTVKTLINQTPGEFAVLAKETLWKRLELSAYEDAKQLTGNRLAERIRLELREKDVEKILTRRLGIEGETLKVAVRGCMQHAPRHGNLAFVREVIARLTDDPDASTPTGEQIVAAIAAEVSSR
jgi:hypothetical protein